MNGVYEGSSHGPQKRAEIQTYSFFFEILILPDPGSSLFNMLDAYISFWALAFVILYLWLCV